MGERWNVSHDEGKEEKMKRSLNILLADDEEIVHQTIDDYLRDSGHNVYRVHGASSAIKAVKNLNYDISLVDLQMIGMEDFSLLIGMQKIRPDMPVVVLTEYGNMKMALQALKLGATDYLLKPIKLLELDAALEKSIRIRNLIIQSKKDGKESKVNHDRLQIQRFVGHPAFFNLLLINFLIAAFL